MRYILDDKGYVKYCSNTYITCENKTCTPYEGTIPDGYETIEEWVQKANIRAYKIVSGNLTYDSAKDAELQNEYNNCGVAGEIFLYNNEDGATGSITLSDAVTNYKYLEIYYGADDVYASMKIHNPKVGKLVGLPLDFTNNVHTHLLYSSTYTIASKKLTFTYANNDFITVDDIVGNYGTASYIKIYRVVGLK